MGFRVVGRRYYYFEFKSNIINHVIVNAPIWKMILSKIGFTINFVIIRKLLVKNFEILSLECDLNNLFLKFKSVYTKL